MYHFDEDVSLQSVDLLRARGFDIVTYADLGLNGAADYVHLAAAAKAGRILVTHNRKDFVLLHGAWFHWSAVWNVTHDHSGILILEQPLPPAVAAEAILELEQIGWTLENRIFYWRRRHGWQEWIER